MKRVVASLVALVVVAGAVTLAAPNRASADGNFFSLSVGSGGYGGYGAGYGAGYGRGCVPPPPPPCGAYVRRSYFYGGYPYGGYPYPYGGYTSFYGGPGFGPYPGHCGHGYGPRPW